MKRKKWFKPKIAGILSLFLLSGCSGHPAAGDWLASSENSIEVSKISVHFDPIVKFYSGASNNPVMQCGWWALDKKRIEMECVLLTDTNIKQKYQLNVIAEDKAELIQDKKIIATLIRQ